MTPGELGRRMFINNANTFLDAPGVPETLDRMWHEDTGIRDFWTAEATFVLETLAADFDARLDYWMETGE